MLTSLIPQPINPSELLLEFQISMLSSFSTWSNSYINHGDKSPGALSHISSPFAECVLPVRPDPLTVMAGAFLPLSLEAGG